MRKEIPSHLSEESFNDILIGLGSLESQAHLASCEICRGKLNEVDSGIRLLDRAALSWSEARPRVALRKTGSARPNAVLWTQAGWLVAGVAFLLAISSPFWVHNHRQSSPMNTATASVDSEAQIAQDNELLHSVSLALDEPEPSPISEYYLEDSAHASPKVKVRRP